MRMLYTNENMYILFIFNIKVNSAIIKFKYNNIFGSLFRLFTLSQTSNLQNLN